MITDLVLIQFTTLLSLDEVQQFRGAVLDALKDDSDVLLHNHLDDNYNYDYPMVQYKSIDTKAAILCIGEGTDMIDKLMRVFNRTVNIGRRRVCLEVENITRAQVDIDFCEPRLYHISDWLPLNEENYAKFIRMRDEESRYHLLEHTLTGNILAMAKSIGHFFEGDVECRILQLDKYRQQIWKGVKVCCFDADFVCNVTLPDFIGLGKHSSFGFGRVENNQD